MTLLYSIIPLLSYFFSGFKDYFFIILCLAFLATVPYFIRKLFRFR